MINSQEETEIRKTLLDLIKQYHSLSWSEDSEYRTKARKYILGAYESYTLEKFDEAKIQIELARMYFQLQQGSQNLHGL